MENQEPVLWDGFDYITYLVGSMQLTAEGDGGQAKRDIVEKELLSRNIYPINPVRLEATKTGTSCEDLTGKMRGWIASGNWEKFRQEAIFIWKGKTFLDEKGGMVHIPGDIEYCLMSDWITFTLNKGDGPCGSYMEVGIAMEHNIPIYLITDMPKKELKQSLLQAIEVSDGEVFNNVPSYLEFIDKKYNLKKAKD